MAASRDIQTHKYGFCGSGIIAEVFIERLLKGAGVPPENILATDIRQERLSLLQDRFGIRVSDENPKITGFARVIFLAVPPKAVKEVLGEIKESLPPEALIVSLAAAIPTQFIEQTIQRPLSVVRVIPNTPSLIGRGMNPHCLGRYVNPEEIPFIENLLGVFGDTVRIEEHLMNAVSALTAVGPTYVFPVMKALMEAAVRLGIPEQQAQRMVAQTVSGAAEMVLQTGKDPEVLKTMIGTRTLKEEEARTLFFSAVEAAFEKISESEKKLATIS